MLAFGHARYACRRSHCRLTSKAALLTVRDSARSLREGVGQALKARGLPVRREPVLYLPGRVRTYSTILPLTALPITSAGRFLPLGPLGIRWHLDQRSDQAQQCLLFRPISAAQELAQLDVG